MRLLQHRTSSTAGRTQASPADQGPSTAEAHDLLAIAEAADQAESAEQIQRDAALALELQAQYSVTQHPVPAPSARAHLPQHQGAPADERPREAMQPHGHAGPEPDNSGTEVCGKPGDRVICLDRTSNAAFGCGHVCLCVQCSRGLRNYPLCRKAGAAIKLWM